MNKNESKYFNTAKLMDEALVILLAKKDYELITVKDVCEKAGVNRSTFYLHYENMDDLLMETIDGISNLFLDKFKENDAQNPNINAKSLDELVFINEKYLMPYLEFVKENKNIYKLIHTKPHLFKAQSVYRLMFEKIFEPILSRFGFNKDDSEYIMEYYVNGVISVVMRWASNDCKEDISKIYEIILTCVKPRIDDKK